MTTPYELLGIDAGASEAAIRAAFRSAAMKYHPDLHGGDRNNERQLRGLIAARDFVMRSRRRARVPGRRLPRMPGKMGRIVIAGAFLGVASLLLLAAATLRRQPPAVGPSPLQTSAISLEEAAIPDAGSADVKAIRDMLEEAEQPGAAEPQLRGSPASPRRLRGTSRASLDRAVTRAVSQASRRWWRIVSRLQGI